MLTEMVCAKELFGLVALAKLMRVIQVLCSGIPVRWVRKFFAAEPTQVGRCWTSRVGVERSLNTSKCSTRPGMTPQMQRILMTLGLIFVLEPVRAVLTNVLLF